jgi:hypothetical protein
MDMSDEAFALYEWSDDMEDGDEEDIPLSTAKIELFLHRYAIAKAAKVKTIVHCPTCNKKHVKSTYHNIFCKNRKCKDTYWNTVDDARRDRAKAYSK